MSFLGFLGGLFKKPLAMIMIVGGAVISLLMAALQRSKRQKSDMERDLREGEAETCLTCGKKG